MNCTKHRPLKIFKNLIQRKVNTNLFPCPIILDSTEGPQYRIFDSSGNELPRDNVRLLGKTTEWLIKKQDWVMAEFFESQLLGRPV